MMNSVPDGAGQKAEDRAEEVCTLATAYELLAFSFRYPGAELADAVASGEWAEAAAEVAGALGLALPQGWDAGLAAYAGQEPESLLHALRAEATRLFVGAPEPAVSPYEGVWRAADDGVQALLFVNPHSMAVERFMRSCGVGRPEGTNEPLDRIDAELELLQYLCMLDAGPAGAPEGAGPPEGGWAAARERFLEEHALAWMPRFADKVAEESREPFFRAAAGLLKATI
ncbi:TorD/DmsD family molecular chaperone [Raoultibacter phocaeensis]|uniref:TorD/DmsD family molecular chaperone n=1 Tax=Raoultibacter phocaeensis TaxID=2479841 RepID=UPI00210212E9|nr:molecular chaperone TorD family protein [Raoultibacter phocaeensis]